MSKKQFKSQASSSRAISSTFADTTGTFGNSTFGAAPASPLSYVYEFPDLSRISEPNVVVAFKNLQKKDGTTKAKALEDLQAYVISEKVGEEGVESPVLETWINLYPRTSIDSSRRVRQLAHTLHGEISSSCGKRIARYMPMVVGAWLAGLHDNDKLVGRAAQEAFQNVFSIRSKQDNVWLIYRKAIFEYCRDAILREDVRTLSDERTTSPDVAEAKYARVIGTALLTVSSAVAILPANELQLHNEPYREILRAQSVWKLASHDDPFVRKAVYSMLWSLLQNSEVNVIDHSLIGTYVVQEALNIDQTGSAYEYSKTLTKLTAACPDVWTAHYTGSGKHSANKRLYQFLSRGSRGGPPDFWKQILLLVHEIPSEVNCSARKQPDDTTISEITISSYPLLDAIQSGIGRKDEHPANHGEAWRTYLSIAKFYLPSLSIPEIRRFLEVYGVPIMEQYLTPKTKGERWAVLGPERDNIYKEAMRLISESCPELFELTWNNLSYSFVQELHLSLPEQSKDFTRSQDSIILAAERWYALHPSIIRGAFSESGRATLLSSTRSEVGAAIAMLGSRNGKPYCAAAALEAAVRRVPELTTQVNATKEILLNFIKANVPALLLSPSSPYLIRMLNAFENEPGMEEFWHESIHTLTNSPDTPIKLRALQSLISLPELGKKGLAGEVVAVVKRSLHQALNGNRDFWPLVSAAMSNPSLSDGLTEHMLVRMTKSLSIETEILMGLHGLNLVTEEDASAVLGFTSSPKGATLLSRLLFLMESPSLTISRGAQNLDSAIRNMDASEAAPRLVQSSMISIIKDGIETADATSLSIVSLESEATELFRRASSEEKSNVAEALLPDAAQWSSVFTPFLLHRPDTSLAITNSLGGALHIVDRHPELTAAFADSIPRDANGYSSALRMAWYVVALCESSNMFDMIAPGHKAVVFQYMALFVQLATDNLSVLPVQGLWSRSQTQQEAMLSEVVAQAQLLIATWLRGPMPLGLELIELTRDTFIRSSGGTSTIAYYSARAYVAVTLELEETNLSGLIKRGQHDPKVDRTTTNPFTTIAVLTSMEDPKLVLRTCNKMIADLTSLKAVDDLAKSLQEFVMLNSALRRLQDLEHLDGFPQPRLVFFTKHIASQLLEGCKDLPVITEMHKVLALILSLVQDVYGSFWEDVIEILVIGCNSAVREQVHDVPFLHACVKLHETMRRLATTVDQNEDLTEAWSRKQSAATKSLFGLLKFQAKLPDDANQPRRILNELLEHQLTSPIPSDFDSKGELYPVLACESAALQHTAYEMLHKEIPKNQEDLSIEAALSQNLEAKLPEEILSLIIVVPRHNEPLVVDWETALPLSLRGYLLSWILVFDHWTNASYKLQCDYVTCIKEGTYLNHFLTFASDYLIGSRAKPIDGSRYSPETYSASLEDDPEKDTTALILHVYYLCLKNLPTLSKSWWRDACSRQLQKPTGAWTEKYISPLVITAELATVTAWLPSQDTSSEPLIVKVSPRAHELTASYPLDEQYMSIRIILPPTYPFVPVLVESGHRVGIDEKKWRSWLLTTAGVINFSGTSGAIIEGLVSWRKNVTGALKGQSECAICYSVEFVPWELLVQVVSE
ncbi:hypothetical protein MMC13_002298 [Lambiella insularis]|nr:hypothetical protein [Lambiella insularis]